MPFRDNYRLFIDDFSSPSLEDLTYPVFSPDGVQWAFFGIIAGSIRFYCCDENGDIYYEALDATDFGEIVFSADGTKIA